jgi:hypothetical protein
MDDRVRDSGGGEAHFSDEFQERGKSPTLNSAPGKYTKTSAEKSTGQYLIDRYIDVGASPCVIQVRNPFPDLIFARKKWLRVVKISDLAFLPENTTKNFKRMMRWNTLSPCR